MTDNEIIKEATEAVTKGYPCAFYVPLLLEVIKSKDAEIERLQCSAKRYGKRVGSLIYHLEQAKSEAYREFAERLKAEYGTFDWEMKTCIYTNEDIDTTLKELTEKNDFKE